MTTEGLHPRVMEIVDALEAAQRDFLALMDAIPAAQCDMPAGEGRWSIAQHVEHLAMVEDGAGRLMNKLIKQVRAAGAQETDDSPISPSLERYRIWTVVRPIEAPEIVQPREGLSVNEGLARLSASRARMIEVLRSASGLALSTASAPHPFFGPLSVYQWGLVAAQHQRRHAALIQGLAGTAGSAG